MNYENYENKELIKKSIFPTEYKEYIVDRRTGKIVATTGKLSSGAMQYGYVYAYEKRKRKIGKKSQEKV